MYKYLIVSADPQLLNALEHTRRRLMENVRKQEELAGEAAHLRQTIAALERSCGLPPSNTLGITDAVVDVLRLANGPIQPPVVKRMLEGMGHDLSRYKNSLAVIHTTLKRLYDSEEVDSVRLKDGGTGYILAKNRRGP